MSAPIIPARKSHLHPECVSARDCRGKGWCFGQTCDLLPRAATISSDTLAETGRLDAAFHFDRAGVKQEAKGRCLTCRRRDRVVAGADPITRHPEGQP